MEPVTVKRMITKRMTWLEMCDQFQDHVCVVEVDRTGDLHGRPFHTARVIGHGPTRTDALVQARLWGDRYEATEIYFTGPIVVRAFPRIAMTDEIRQLARALRGPYPE